MIAALFLVLAVAFVVLGLGFVVNQWVDTMGKGSDYFAARRRWRDR